MTRPTATTDVVRRHDALPALSIAAGWVMAIVAALVTLLSGPR